MDKREYVSCIERALVGKISPTELRDTVQYYRDYIDMEIRKGKTEQQVLEELGNPRLLARTIAMTHGDDVAGFDAESDGHNGHFGQSAQKVKSWHIPFTAVIVILLLILMLVASLVLSVARILLPIVLPVLMILWIVRLLKRNQ